MKLAVIILAAGQGKRMVSDLPKVLHPIGGKPMLGHVLDVAIQLNAEQSLVVYGHGGERVQSAFAEQSGITWVEQKEQLGTGHAVAQTFESLPDEGVALVLFGDVPMIRAQTLQPVIASASQGHLSLLTVLLDDPGGYGRIVRDADAQVKKIVEDKDASAEEKQIQEINTGILAAPIQLLRAWVDQLNNDNAQGEYYLTDIIEMAVNEGVSVDAVVTQQPMEVQGVNNRIQLAELERYYQSCQAEQLMINGATLLDPARVDVRGKVTTGKDVVIDVNVVFEGDVTLGDRVRIGANCVIQDSIIGDDCEILPSTIIEQSKIGEKVVIGPFARLRPGAQLANKSKIGNFVEIKKSVIGEGSKVNHLSYIGDSEMGRDVNIGAGTITANYDGANKHKTVIADNASTGSNTVLVAPMRLGEKATTGAGSVLSKDVADNVLVVTRSPIRTIAGWKRPAKKKT